MRKLSAATAALLVTTALVNAPGYAASAPKTDTTAQEIQSLQAQLRALQQQLDTLRANQDQAKVEHDAEMKQKMAAEEQAKQAAMLAGAKFVMENGKQVMLPPPPGPKVVEPANHRFQLSSGDGAWTIAPTGRLHFDIGAYLDQTPQAGSTLGTGTNHLASGVNVRRGRFGVTGKAMNDFTYTLILDGGGTSDSTNSTGAPFGGASNSILNTAELSYTGLKNTSIDFGYFAQYALLEEATSSNDILFMERSTPDNLAAGNTAGDPRFGAGVRHWGPNYWVGAYITGTQPGAAHQALVKPWNFFARGTYQIIQEDTKTLHVGANVITTLQVPNSAAGAAQSLTLSDRPELRIDPNAYFSSGALGPSVANPLTSLQIYNVETAGTYGGWFAQAEYYKYVANRLGLPRLNFDGEVAQIAYAWGGTRKYTANCGCYGGINPITPFSLSGGGMGAFEVAARFDTSNLTDLYNSSLPTASQTVGFINGGRLTNYTLGVNWFINANMMFKVNYIHSLLSKANSSATGVATPAGFKMDALAGRVQFVF